MAVAGMLQVRRDEQIENPRRQISEGAHRECECEILSGVIKLLAMHPVQSAPVTIIFDASRCNALIRGTEPARN